MNKEDKTYHTRPDADTNFGEKEMHTDASEGWELIGDDARIDDSVNRINAFVNKTLESRRKHTARKPPRFMNTTVYIWIILIMALVFLSFILVLKIT